MFAKWQSTSPQMSFYRNSVLVLVILVDVYPVAQGIHGDAGGMAKMIAILQSAHDDAGEDVAGARELNGDFFVGQEEILFCKMIEAYHGMLTLYDARGDEHGGEPMALSLSISSWASFSEIPLPLYSESVRRQVRYSWENRDAIRSASPSCISRYSHWLHHRACRNRPSRIHIDVGAQCCLFCNSVPPT